jgi:hypothetical protein
MSLHYRTCVEYLELRRGIEIIHKCCRVGYVESAQDNYVLSMH